MICWYTGHDVDYLLQAGDVLCFYLISHCLVSLQFFEVRKLRNSSCLIEDEAWQTWLTQCIYLPVPPLSLSITGIILKKKNWSFHMNQNLECEYFWMSSALIWHKSNRDFVFFTCFFSFTLARIDQSHFAMTQFK